MRLYRLCGKDKIIARTDFAGRTTLFAALEVHPDEIGAGHYRRKRRRQFLDFMNRILAQYPGTELHVVLDNPDTVSGHVRWLARLRCQSGHLHYTPTHAPWLIQIELCAGYIGVTRAVLRGLSATNPRQACQAIDRWQPGTNTRRPSSGPRALSIPQDSNIVTPTYAVEY